MTRKPILVVQGAQWGSEAKGNIAAYLCQSRGVDFAVRTGAVNAGHTVVYNGVKYAMQQLPTGWINPSTRLVIGPGGYIHWPTLKREIDLINAAMPDANVLDRLGIDFNCGTHTDAHSGLSSTANRHYSIGATGKGCSEAIVDKIKNRNNGYQLFMETDESGILPRAVFTNTTRMLNTEIDDGALILIEGTQGTLLDLHLGPYPFTTSRMTTAANWVAECGLSTSLDYEVVLVVRTYPIRVAGNSGPMNNEIEWVDLANTINNKLITDGRPALVSLVALTEFESKLVVAASEATTQGKYKVPTIGREFRTRLSEWTANERSQYRAAASELHRDALNLCSPETVVELKKLFEMTTVTKKLRRIARMSIPDLEWAIQVNRPSSIALTFLDYIHPEMAGVSSSMYNPLSGYAEAVSRALYSIRDLESRLGVPITLTSTGPGLDDVHNVSVLKEVYSGNA